ncbi:hypothetical protein N9L68_07560, partial [bacterium]|nr:hypothetical protein [bacterium]
AWSAKEFSIYYYNQATRESVWELPTLRDSGASQLVAVVPRDCQRWWAMGSFTITKPRVNPSGSCPPHAPALRSLR